MAKGEPNKEYTGELKQLIVETMHKEGLGYKETMCRFEIRDYHIIQRWEHIYLEKRPEWLYIERRGRACSADGTKKTDHLSWIKRLRKTELMKYSDYEQR